MKNTLILLFQFLITGAFSQTFFYNVDNCHSHNDYEQPIPFWTAYNQGFGSMEADIHLFKDSLIVAHDVNELKMQNTFQRLYLNPIDSCIRMNNGFIYSNHEKKLQLLIDIKTESLLTLQKLVSILERYPAIIKSRSVVLTISGNKPNPEQFVFFPDYLKFDGILTEKYSNSSFKRIPMLSDNIAKFVKGSQITPNERDTLKVLIDKAHQEKKKVRLWGTPDRLDVWKELMQLKVDYINTDHIDALAEFLSVGDPAVAGSSLPFWKKGFLDIHHINTGRGNVAYFIFPDSTNMLVDAGEEDITEPRTLSLRNSTIHPNDSKKPYEWIQYYLKKVTPFSELHLDYAVISHFHEDHFGGWYRSAPKSNKGDYILSGITGVGELIPIRHLLDRGYPDYDIPFPFEKMMSKLKGMNSNYPNTMHNYFAFTSALSKNGGSVERFRAGTKSQIQLLRNKE